MAAFAARLETKQTRLLAGATAAVLAIIALMPLLSSLSGGRLAVWCSEMMATEMVRLDGAALAVGAIAGLSAAMALAAFVGESVAAARLRRRIAERTMPRAGKVSAALAAIGASDAPVIVVRDVAPYAYTVGALRSTVVLSSALVSAFSLEEIKTVLRHELRHLIARHPLRSLLWALCCRAFFFLPALRDLSEHFALAREIDADRAAADGKRARRALASALLKASSPGVTGVAAFVSFGHLAGRIDALHGGRGARIRIDAVRAAVSALAIVSAMVAAVPAHADEPPASARRCRTEIARRADELFTRAFPPGPSSTETVAQSREIVP